MLQWIQELWQQFAADIPQLLPYSPFLDIEQNWNPGNGVAWLNWFIDIPGMITILFAWVGCYAAYLAVRIVMRWIKAVS